LILLSTEQSSDGSEISYITYKFIIVSAKHCLYTKYVEMSMFSRLCQYHYVQH